MSSYPASLCFKVREHHSCRWLQTEMPGSSSVILFTVWWRGFPPNHYPAVVSTYHTCHRSVPNLDRIHGRSGSRPNPTTVRINSWEAIHNIQLHTHSCSSASTFCWLKRRRNFLLRHLKSVHTCKRISIAAGGTQKPWKAVR